MMNFEEFTEAVLAGICKKAGGMFDASIHNVTKTNGIKLTGITAREEGCNCAPCVYLDKFYMEYQNGEMNLSETVEEIYRILSNHMNDTQNIDISVFLDWETVKGSIYAKVINAEKNKDLLKEIPHRLFLDMAVAYYAVIDGFTALHDTGTILICNRHMEMWGQDERNLYRQAIYNMRSDGNPCFDSIETVVRSIMFGTDGFFGGGKRRSGMDMYILTNCRKYFGASEILDKNTMHSIADKIGDGFIVLPSSLHEVIILPPKNEKEYGELADMVKEVNATQVSVAECLSDHVYVYSRDDEMLKIVA